MGTPVVIRDNAEAGSYDAFLADRIVGTVVYVLREGRMVIRHTVVDPEFRGQGIASALARTALDDITARGLTLTNYCGFIADFIDRNPAYAAVVDGSKPGRPHPRDAALRAAEPKA